MHIAFISTLEDRHMVSATFLRRICGASVVFSAFASGTAQAQASSTQNTTGQITARVFAPLTVVKNEDLRFGNLFAPYAAKVVAFTDNAASGGRARFTLAGEGGAELSVVVNVPSTIASGGNTLPVGSFNLRRHTTDADVGGTDATLATGDNTFTVTLSGAAGASGNLYLRVNGTATPGASQATGAYAGTIAVTVNYTGA
jgi:Domain of unknown function (DUF4402)